MCVCSMSKLGIWGVCVCMCLMSGLSISSNSFYPKIIVAVLRGYTPRAVSPVFFGDGRESDFSKEDFCEALPYAFDVRLSRGRTPLLQTDVLVGVCNVPSGCQSCEMTGTLLVPGVEPQTHCIPVVPKVSRDTVSLPA